MVFLYSLKKRIGTEYMKAASTKIPKQKYFFLFAFKQKNLSLLIRYSM